MANDSNEGVSLFEAHQADRPSEGETHATPTPKPKPGNRVALAGAALSFLPPVGLVLSAIGFVRSRSRDGAGRMAALIGITLAVVFGGIEGYVASTAPLLDSGCLDANPAATRLRTLQATPGGNLPLLAKELDAIHTTLAGAANDAGSAQVRSRIELVASDVEALSADVMKAQANGDLSQLLVDEAKLQRDGNAADSYCHSL